MSDLELDKLASEAEESYKTLMDLGMNVDSRYSGRIFEVASSMLKNAIKNVNQNNQSIIYGYSVKDPGRYGVVQFDENLNLHQLD